MDVAGLVDRTYGPHPLGVTAEAVAAYVAATGDDSDRWKTAAPPGFISAALFVVAPELLNELFEHSVIHGEQTFTWDRPMSIGSELSVSGVVSKVRERGGVHFVNFEIDVSDDEGSVASGAALFLVSGEAKAASADERPEPAHDDRGNPDEGQVVASRGDLVRYAAASGDWNPVHWDHDSAVAAGLPGVVVHGLLQAAWAFQAATKRADRGQSLTRSRVRFRSPMLPASPARVIAETTGTTVNVTIRDAAAEYLSARIELSDE